MIRFNTHPSQQFRVTSTTPVHTPGKIEMRFGVLTELPDEMMGLRYEILSPNTLGFRTSGGPSDTLQVRDGDAGGSRVVPCEEQPCAGEANVRVRGGRRDVRVVADLMGSVDDLLTVRVVVSRPDGTSDARQLTVATERVTGDDKPNKTPLGPKLVAFVIPAIATVAVIAGVVSARRRRDPGDSTRRD